MSRHDLPMELMDLLADRATQGLDSAEHARAEALLASLGLRDDESFDLAAAAADVALARGGEAMPADAKARLITAAQSWRTGVTRVHPPSVAPEARADVAGRIGGAGGRTAGALGWLAAAACLTLAALGWLRGGHWSAADPKAQEARIAQEPDAVQWFWAATPESRIAGVEGRVTFSATRQAGFLRLRNLPALGADQQYQLWIVDPDRKQPVDGGVFDAAAAATADVGGEVVIPIDLKLRVEKPAAFAITIERRGGVVVSDGPIAALATPPKG